MPLRAQCVLAIISLALSACMQISQQSDIGTAYRATSALALTQAAPVPAEQQIAPQTYQPPIYDLLADDLPVREVLFALARDAQLNLSLPPSIAGSITLRVTGQPLDVILDRLSRQVPFRYQIDGDALLIQPDAAYLEIYPIDYLNIARDTSSQIDLATQIGSIRSELSASGAGSNSSQTQLSNRSSNNFWRSLLDNLNQIIGVTGTSSDTAASRIIAHPEAGFISVHAKARQHRILRTYLARIMQSVHRQALIEATIVEVALNDSHKSGVDWSLLSTQAQGIDIRQSLSGGASARDTLSAPNFLLSYNNQSASQAIVATINLLHQYGDVRILSSPKIISMNNQTAVLKVVDNRVYFTMSVTPATVNSNGDTVRPATRQTDIHTVPIGFVMHVTPFIDARGQVLLNVRPSISRILGFADDPNPDLAEQGIRNRIPEIQVREMESLLRVGSGQVAVIGGLMQDKIETHTNSVYLLSSLPLIGPLFSYQEQTSTKTELMIFLRPVVLELPTLTRALQPLLARLPDTERNLQTPTNLLGP